MLKSIDAILKRTSPWLHGRLKQWFRSFKKKTNPQLSKAEFVHLLKSNLGIKQGDVVFIHSSMRNLYLDFDKGDVLNVLSEVVGPDGTLLFPCWQFNVRAEDYIRENDIVFDLKKTPSAMGKIPDVLRADPKAFRSFHPTNSVVAIGKHARELTTGHETDIYPCGEASPWHKMLRYPSKIIGLGVTVDNLTFVHAIEDKMRDTFPVKTRNPEVYSCKCIDATGDVRYIDTLVASKAIGHRNVYDFFKKHVSARIYRDVKMKNMTFFSLDAVPAFDELTALALKNKTIYSY
jgi:aminoglycoside 3-N-acetyltransferase